MCDQKWSLILKTSCITPWFQWILIFMTFLHLKSDSDHEVDHQIEEIHHKSRLKTPIDVDFSDSTLAYIDSDNYDHGYDTGGRSAIDASILKKRRQSMTIPTGAFQEDMEAGQEHFDPIELHTMHDPVFSAGHSIKEKMILPSKYCLAAHHSRLASLLFSWNC